MIEQKSAELLFAVPVAKRKLAELKRVIAQANHAQKYDILHPPYFVFLITSRLFDALAKDKGPVPYDPEVARHRRKYGDTLLRKADDHLSNQRAFEEDQQRRVEEAKKRREEDREKKEALTVCCFKWISVPANSFSRGSWMSNAGFRPKSLRRTVALPSNKPSSGPRT